MACDQALPTIKFYTKHSSNIVKNIGKNYKGNLAKPLPEEFKSRLAGPSVAWKIFRRQQLAIDYANVHTKDAMVFSYEDRTPFGNGRRMFLVTHPKHMWLIHKARPLPERCSYEVIQEGRPCKLYFDLEYYRCCNPDKDGYVMTEIFVKCVIAALKEKHNVCCQSSDILWLDSSTHEKYSVHLIFQLKNVAFQNNLHTGMFVSTLLLRIKNKVESIADVERFGASTEELKELFVETKNGNKVLFCDESVYTKNRNFRLFLSTKFGKNVPLVVSRANKYVPAGEKSMTDDSLLFFDSLVTYFRENCDIKFLIEDESAEHVKYNYISGYKTNGNSITGCQTSPFPEIDSHVLSFVSDNNKTGVIRKWTYFNEQDMLIYDVANYRYCGNIKRHHKSNNIIIVVELRKGIYYQKCYDPVCRMEGYKSEAFSLPAEVLPSFYLNDDFFNICWEESVSCQNTNIHETVAEIEMQTSLVKGFDKIDDKLNSQCNDLFMDFVTKEDEIEMVKVAEAVEDTITRSFITVSEPKIPTYPGIYEFENEIIPSVHGLGTHTNCSQATNYNDYSIPLLNMDCITKEEEIALVQAAETAEANLKDLVQTQLI